jgi:hypothetical protein
VLACYKGLVGMDVRRIALSGDSAGGNLALVLASLVAGGAAGIHSLNLESCPDQTSPSTSPLNREMSSPAIRLRLLV